MPSLIKHIPPDFNINTVKGWNTRLLYNFYGSPATAPMDYVSVTGADYTINIFDAIDTWANGIGSIVSKGQFLFPHRYFKTGKSIRVRGKLIISVDGSSPLFNINARIDNSNNGLILLANQNDNNDHQFPDKDNVPVDFEIVYNSIELKTPELVMQANGYYQYNTDSYNTPGPNSNNIYVPIWNSEGPYIQVENSLSGTNKICINFANSNSISNIKIHYLTVEELS